MKLVKIDSLKNKLFIMLALVMTVYTSILVYCQSIMGISYWDIFVYLGNAMLFAHMNIGSQLSVPPVLSLLTAIPLSLGFVSETSMFVVSGILFIFLVLGIYMLFNERFNPWISFIGSIFFSMLSLVVTWAVSGSNDLPAMAFSVWALYFTIKGLNVDFKYYYAAYICFVLAFFTRFTEGFIFIIMLAYLIMNFDKFKKQCENNSLLKLILFIIAVAGIIGAVYLINQGSIPFISQFMEVSNSNQVSNVNVGYELNPFYYIQNLPDFLTSMSISNSYNNSLTTKFNAPTILSYVIIILGIAGIFSVIYNGITKTSVNNRKLKVVTLCILSLITIITYTHISYIITELLFIVIVLLFYRFFKENIETLDILMILLLGIFFIMHSYHPVKVDRYILPTFIPITYYMIIGINHITQKISKNKKTTLTILTILLIILIPINASYIHSMTHENPHSHEEKAAANWLENYDKNLIHENISSDRGVAFSWYLKKYTYTTIPRVLKANNDTLQEKLESINAKYYIDSTSNTTNIEGYHIIYDNHNESYKIKIYEHDRE